jgi:ABC-type nickel/cobalt efflux system permease component RcnA
MTICSQASNSALSSFGCFIYNFQTLLTGVVAILVAILGAIFVWRQLKDTNLQARISHRETLATLLRAALHRYAEVEKSIREPLSTAGRITSDPIGEPAEIEPEDAHHLEGMFHGVLNWYLIVLADTEHADIETRKVALREALQRLVQTLGEAHWADHNNQHDEDHDFSDPEWAEVLARCEQAKIDASARVSDVGAAYRKLQEAQQRWVRSLRSKIARLDSQIAGAE